MKHLIKFACLAISLLILSIAHAQKIAGEGLPRLLHRKQNQVLSHTRALFAHQLDSLTLLWQADKTLSLTQVVDRVDSIHTAQSDLLTWIKDEQKDFRDSVRDEVHGRVDSVIQHFDRWSHLELGVDLLSRQVFNGRTAGVSPSFFPSLTYRHYVGLYASAGFSGYFDTTSSQSRRGRPGTTNNQLYPSMEFTIGFSRTLFNSLDIDLFYNRSVNLFTSQFQIGGVRENISTKNLLANTMGIYVGYDFFDYIKLAASYNYVFGSFSYATTDAATITKIEKQLAPLNYLTKAHLVNVSLSKDFRFYHFLGAKIFSVIPQLDLGLGSDAVASALNRQRGANQNSAVDTTGKSYTGLLALDASLTLDYRIKNLEISLAPRLALPFNTYNYQLQKRESGLGTPVFYVSVGVKYIFKFWKDRYPIKRNKLG
jgi:hypothetical protein